MTTEQEYQEQIKRLEDLLTQTVGILKQASSDFKYSVNDLTSLLKEQELKYEKVIAEKESEILLLKTMAPVAN